MKPKTLILMGLAVTCGLGASYMTSRLLAERRSPDEPERVEILVATRHLSVHERLNKPEELFEKKSVLKDEAGDAIQDYETLKGKVLKQGRNKGDQITATNLYDKFSHLEIPEGYQAVGLPVDLRTTLHGLASLPGSRVNMMLTLRAQNPEATRAFVLLENVLVLAADVETNAEGKIAAPAQVVTFALKDEDALKVTMAKEMGVISLILRKPDDKTKVKVPMMTGAQVLGGQAKASEPEPTRPVEIAKEQPKPVVVEEKKTPEAPPEPKVVQYDFQLINGTRVESTTYTRTDSGEIRSQDTKTSGGNNDKKSQLRKHSFTPPLDQ